MLKHPQAKGNRNEKRAQTALEKRGFLVERPRRSKWKRVDFWGLYDLIALSPTEMLLVQVKSNRCPKKVREAIRDFPCPPFVQKQIWVYKDRQKEPELVSLNSTRGKSKPLSTRPLKINSESASGFPKS